VTNKKRLSITDGMRITVFWLSMLLVCLICIGVLAFIFKLVLWISIILGLIVGFVLFIYAGLILLMSGR